MKAFADLMWAHQNMILAPLIMWFSLPTIF